MQTLKVSTWGKMKIGAFTVRKQDYETIAEAVARSIGRRLGLTVCGGPRCDGQVVGRDGVVEHSVYQVTLGRPCRGGGYSVSGEIWFSVR